MSVYKVMQALLIAILPAALSPVIIVAQQQSAIAGEITALKVLPLPSATYLWALYRDSAADFAMFPGISGGIEAGFVDGIDDQPAVQVKWNQPGTYFIKILIIDSDGCSNFKVGIVEVLPGHITARIYPNPMNGNDLDFEISIPEGDRVTIDIFSPNKQFISRIFNEFLPGGVTKTIHYRDNLPQGIYTYRIMTKKQVTSGRIICIRVY